MAEFAKILKGRMGNGVFPPEHRVEDPEEQLKRKKEKRYFVRNNLQEVPQDQALLVGTLIAQKSEREKLEDQRSGLIKKVNVLKAEVDAALGMGTARTSMAQLRQARSDLSRFDRIHKLSCNKCGGSENRDFRGGLCDRCAFPGKREELERAQKFNPNHDEAGRFAETDSGTSADFGGHQSAAAYADAHAGDVTDEHVLAALTKSERAEYDRIQGEVTQAVKAGKTTDQIYSSTGAPARGLADYTPERQAVHDKILNEMFKDADKYKPAPGEAPTMVMLGGRGGSGKSSFNGKVYDREKSLVLDSDEFKSKLPGYDPGKPFLYHEESSHLLNEAVRRARDSGLNVTIDVTMGSPSAIARVDQFNAMGYKTEAHYMYVPGRESSQRALLRWARPSKGKPMTGRLVPPHVIFDMKDNERIFDKVKAKAGKWSFWDNQSGLKKVASSGHG